MREELQKSFTTEVFDLSRSFPLAVRREIDELTQNPNRRQSFRNYSPIATAALIIWAAYMTCNEVDDEHWFNLLPSVEETNFDALENIRARLVRLVTGFHGGTCYLDSIIGDLDDSVITVDYLALIGDRKRSSSNDYSLGELLRQAVDLTLESPSLNSSYIKTKISHNMFSFDSFSVFPKSVMNDNLSTDNLEEILDEVLLINDNETKMRQICDIAMNRKSPSRAYDYIGDAQYWNFNTSKAAKNNNFPFEYIVNALNGKTNAKFYVITTNDDSSTSKILEARLDLELSKTGMPDEEIKSLPYEFKKHIFNITT